jgi:long-chain acyl-CoA synthetase
MKSRGVMRGYHGLTEANAMTFHGRWLRTGDIGEIDERGFLRITDRKKDLIKTSGGKYVAPQHIESRLKAACPYLSQVLVLGNNRNFCTALVTLDPDTIERWAKESGLENLAYADLVKHDKVRAMVQEAVDATNAQLARYETIKKFAILEAELSIESGELTPSMKVKRNVVEGKNKAMIDGLYDGAMQDV